MITEVVRDILEAVGAVAETAVSVAVAEEAMVAGMVINKEVVDIITMKLLFPSKAVVCTIFTLYCSMLQLLIRECQCQSYIRKSGHRSRPGKGSLPRTRT